MCVWQLHVAFTNINNNKTTTHLAFVVIKQLIRIQQKTLLTKLPPHIQFVHFKYLIKPMGSSFVFLTRSEIDPCMTNGEYTNHEVLMCILPLTIPIVLEIVFKSVQQKYLDKTIFEKQLMNFVLKIPSQNQHF